MGIAERVAAGPWRSSNTNYRRVEEGRGARSVSGMVIGGPGQPGLEVSLGNLGS